MCSCGDAVGNIDDDLFEQGTRFTWYYSGHHEFYEILQIYTICVAQNARFWSEKCKKFQTPPKNEEGDTPP